MNTIISNIAHFLKEHEPFTYLTSDELNSIASNIGIINLEKNKTKRGTKWVILSFTFYILLSTV